MLALAGLVPLALTAAADGGARRLVGCSVFGVALVLLYATSTLYHALTHARAKQVLRVLDHSAIFLLIAGTYTPFTLVSLRGAWGWSLFGVVWGLAVLGVTLRLALRRRPTALFMAIYLAMGWCVLVALHPLARALAPSGMALLITRRCRLLRRRGVLPVADASASTTRSGTASSCSAASSTTSRSC